MYIRRIGLCFALVLSIALTIAYAKCDTKRSDIKVGKDLAAPG